MFKFRGFNARGFTLIELLVVVVVLGILATIAIPKFRNSKEQAFRSNMKADLRNMVTAQESYLYDNSTYYNGAVPSTALNYTPSTGISATLQNVAISGWGATMNHSNLPGVTCAVFIGTSPAVSPATVEGLIACS